MKFSSFFITLSVILGIIFLAASALLTIRGQMIKKQSVETQGTVIGLSSRGATIRYQSGNIVYRTQLGLYSPMLKPGETIAIYYDPQSPGNITSDLDTETIPLFFGIAGTVLSVFGCTGIALKKKSLYNARWKKSSQFPIEK